MKEKVPPVKEYSYDDSPQAGRLYYFYMRNSHLETI